MICHGAMKETLNTKNYFNRKINKAMTEFAKS